MLFILNHLNELCGAMDKLFDFEFWDRGSIRTRGDFFVLYYRRFYLFYTPRNEVRGVYWNHPVRPSVRL